MPRLYETVRKAPSAQRSDVNAKVVIERHD
jgi:hypothetical protein